MHTMASTQEGGSHPHVSFFDWEGLNEEEYVKVDKIINTPQHPGVQLPFTPNEATADALLFKAPLTMPPVFQPGVPPPTMVGYHPIPVPWAGGMSMHGGYMFPPNPALTTAPATMGFVPSTGHHPMYAALPPHYQGPPVDQMAVTPMAMDPVALGGHVPTDGMAHPANPMTLGGPIPTEPMAVGPLPTHLGMPPPAMGLPLPPAPMYIPHTTVVLPHHTQAPSATAPFAQAPQPPQVAEVPLPAAPPAPLPMAPQALVSPEAAPEQPTTTPCAIEFVGPLLFAKSPVVETKQPVSPIHTELNNNKVATPPKKDESMVSIPNQVVIQMDSIVISNNKPAPVSGGDMPEPQTQAAAPTPDTEAEINTTAETAETTVDIIHTSDTVPENSEVESLPSPVAASKPPGRSWSSLFATKTSATDSAASTAGSNKEVGLRLSSPPSLVDSGAFPSIGEAAQAKASSPGVANERVALVTLEKVTTVGVHSDPLARKVLEQLLDIAIVHAPIVIQPRGLKNGKNTCFLNAPLQVLMGCPPFIHMFRSFKNLPSRKDGKSSTPIFDSLVQFVNSFQNGQRVRHQGPRNKRITSSDLNVGHAFIPEPLLSVAQNVLGLHIGVQHDAEEFLSQILSICNEEMENVLKLKDANGFPAKPVNGNARQAKGSAEDEDSDEAWQQVGPKNHHVETNVNDCGRTPLSSIFAGLSRSCLVRESGKSSDTLDSFFTLKLDIQGDSIHNVKDALLRLNTTETVHDADGRKVHGQRRMFFDVLPPVLIMHLKLFQYSNGNGQKIQKKISFDVDLNVPKEILSRVGKSKYASSKARSYKLFGVVNHHGRKMNDGHYTSDVFLPVANGWLRFDDSEISVIHEADVLHYSERSMPYLLFYRRIDVAS